MFNGKTLLITGGTGSFGNAVLARFLHTDVKEIRIFSRDEKKQDDMRKLFRSEKVKFYLGDVRDIESLREPLIGVNYVFHAAALKQVPSCEFFPIEAIKTNALGTENVLNASVSAGVNKVICLSTDKAVYPINAMGISKAMMEKIATAKARTDHAAETIICTTRYGNVMASRGSVIPLFINQIKQGKPLTITDPEMTRYLMSLDEAVELVLFAYENGRSGDILVQKSPACTVLDLANALLRIFSADNEVRIIGTRHGEKLYETLLTREEMSRSEDLGGYYRIAADNRDLNYEKYFTDGDVKIELGRDYTSHSTRRLTLVETIEALRNLEYVKSELNS